MAIKYVASFKEPLQDQQGRRKGMLLWGDPVHVLDSSGPSWRVRVRGVEGWIAPEKLSDRGLLEIYVIDVGQGDGVLMRTPDDKWHLIDGGVANRAQMT
ncbi:MAG TPA: hypothetical protein VJ692_03440, partial [Nitrospiraceae bacterium]|nr:hypothetical protein [Nitrospiraceae bacterium]